MTDLHCTYLGLPLRSPIVASPSPLTGEVDTIAELERYGAGAIVLPSLFEEQIEHEANEIDRLMSINADSYGEATSFFPDVDDYNSGVDRYLELVESAKATVDVPVIVSLNGASVGGWLRYGVCSRTPAPTRWRSTCTPWPPIRWCRDRNSSRSSSS